MSNASDVAMEDKKTWAIPNFFWGCSASCPALRDELFGASCQGGVNKVHAPWFCSASKGPAPSTDRDDEDDLADWISSSAFCRGQPRAQSSPPPALLVDPPRSSRRSEPSSTSLLDNAVRARERTRLQRLVSDFIHDASSGRSCSVVLLGEDQTLPGSRLEAMYRLSHEADSIVLQTKPKLQKDAVVDLPKTEIIGKWPLRTVLGAHRAEDSALVKSLEKSLRPLVSKDEIGMSAVLDFGGGACTARSPLLLVEDSIEHRDRLVCGLEILRLYRGAAHRLETTRESTAFRELPCPLLATPGAEEAAP